MPPLPLIAWIAVAAAALVLCALCALTIHAVLRPAVRARVEHWSARRVLACVAVAMSPWLVVWLAPIRLDVAIHGILPLLGWLLGALLVFALLVLLPLATVVSGVIWSSRRRRE